ncbi:MAG: hypothetical protein LBF37_03590 [Rickettsiales bacterium]|nr:hypothetical protein [Rickettsiales bacterium]
MRIQMNSLLTRTWGLLVAVIGGFSDKTADAAELGSYPFTPEAKSPCNYTVGGASGNCAARTSDLTNCTNTWYNGLPYFCYDDLTKSRGVNYYLPAIGTPSWNCRSETNNGTVKYRECNGIVGYSSAGFYKAVGGPGPLIGVNAYEFSYQSAMHIIGCVDSSKNLNGAYAGQYYTGNLSSVTCIDAVYCPVDEYGFVPGPFPTGQISAGKENSCYVKDGSVGTDSSGTFTYQVPSGKVYCRCYYDDRYQCGVSS